MEPNPDHRKHAILYVDDEEQALKYFRKGMDKEFQIVTAPSVAQAMALLEAEPAKFAIVITDQRMPGQLGVELLKQVRQRWPSLVRMLITAYSDVDSAIEAVNSGAIYKYITKPADLILLKDTLRGGMELFLTQLERDALLREKLSTLQRVAVADRVRSLAAMAGGISHHLRNSMTAMSCFLEEMSPPPRAQETAKPAPENNAYLKDIWEMARTERQSLLEIVKNVGDAIVEPTCQPASEEDLGQLIRTTIDAAASELSPAKVVFKLAPEPVKLKVDAQMMRKLCATLARYVARLGGANSTLTIGLDAGVPLWNTSGVRISVHSDGPPWTDRELAALFTPFAFPPRDPSDLGLDLLMAFFIAYQHGGDIIVMGKGPAGPGFELLLPLNPSEVRRPDLGEGVLGALSPQSPEPGPLGSAA